MVIRKSFVYRLSSVVVANSEAAAKDVQKICGVPSKKCHVFHNALADARMPNDSASCQRDSNRLICVGRLHPCKGHDTLVRAMGLLKTTRPNLYVELIGNGPEKEPLRRQSQRLGVSDQCVFLGGLPHADVLKRMACAAVCVVPSRSDAFGFVTIESMAVGTPVVASAVGGIPEIIRDGIDGFLVPPGDPVELASRISLLLADAELRKQMGLNARERFLAMFEQGRAVKAEADWFEGLVASGCGPEAVTTPSR
jgi:glycosyltransferase involved in cell wall biosynthesis